MRIETPAILALTRISSGIGTKVQSEPVSRIASQSIAGAFQFCFSDAIVFCLHLATTAIADLYSVIRFKQQALVRSSLKINSKKIYQFERNSKGMSENHLVMRFLAKIAIKQIDRLNNKNEAVKFD